MKKTMLILGALAVVLLMVSTATALPAVNKVDEVGTDFDWQKFLETLEYVIKFVTGLVAGYNIVALLIMLPLLAVVIIYLIFNPGIIPLA